MDFRNSYPHLRQSRTSAPAQDAGGAFTTAANHPGIFQDPQWDILEGGNLSPREYDSIPGNKSPSNVDLNMVSLSNMSHPGATWPQTPHGSAFFGGPGGEMQQHMMNIGLETPISASTSIAGPMLSRTASLGMSDVITQNSPHMIHPYQSFDYAHSAHGFGPGTVTQFGNRASFEAPGSGVNMGDIRLDSAWSGRRYNPSAAATLPPGANENFRFRVVLKEKTAMIKGPDEISVTYLNKCQTYSISITDTMPECSSSGSKYRTAIRISFEDEQQRARPGACWQLWKEGRGTNEAHKRGGKLQAVEYVSADLVHIHDVHSNVRLASENFDGFAVEWTRNLSGSAECVVQARFNFLSTDFSHSKGVKGVPVRLCAKTEVVEPQQKSSKEICYCSVKTFRDHGSERKLQNDKIHVKKCIEKVKQQMEQAEAGLKDSGKRRRSDSVVTQRPTKVAKHMRSWSMSSSASLEGQDPGEGELHIRLRNLEGMFNSIHSASVLNLPGEERDDLDAHPVPLHLPMPSASSEPQNQQEVKRESTQNTLTSSKQSPANSSQGYLSSPAYSQSRTTSHERPRGVQAPHQLVNPPDGPTKIKKVQQQGDGQSVEWIEALGVDPFYQPPPEPVSAVACFYMKPSIAGRRVEDDYYRAVYLTHRNLDSLVHAIALKCNVEPIRITSTIRVNAAGLQIKVEDDMIREMDEGQDLLAELDPTDETPSSAEDFLRYNEDDYSVPGSAASYRLTLRF